MASLSRNKRSGSFLLQFGGPDRRRRSIWLGKVGRRHAEATKIRVEHLVAAALSGHAIDDQTARWLATIGEDLADKLARVGLIPRRQQHDDAVLAAFLDRYIATRTDAKPATLTSYRNVRRNLVDFFGEDKPIRDITPGDGDEWGRWLRGTEKLAENTARKRASICKTIFQSAVRRRLLTVNPFADLKGAVRPNRQRDFFVTLEAAGQVLDACPDAEWRLLFALSRYGGLRCPSETLNLRWGDIDWARGRMHVRSPKTEHHAGRESRIVPLFPELRPYLDEAFELATEGAEHVIGRYRDTEGNLRTQLLRIIRRAGIEPWPKLFMNLRATRQTELEEKFPSHVVCAWMGNTRAIAVGHYLQVTDEHYSRAVEGASNSLQHAKRTDCAPDDMGQETTKKPRETSGMASQGWSLLDSKSGSGIAETSGDSSVSAAVETDALALCAALAEAIRSYDPGLALLIEAWPELPTAAQRQIVRLAQSHR